MLFKRREIVVTIVLHALMLLTAYVFQGMIFPYIRVFGLVPVILPIVSTGAAVFEGRYTGGVMGLLAGILCDISFNEPAAKLTVLLTASGIIVGFLADTVMSRGFPTLFFACTGVLALVAFAQMFSLMFFESVPPAVLLMNGLYQTLYSLIYTVPIYFCIRVLVRPAQRV